MSSFLLGGIETPLLPKYLKYSGTNRKNGRLRKATGSSLWPCGHQEQLPGARPGEQKMCAHVCNMSMHGRVSVSKALAVASLWGVRSVK